MPKYKFSDIAYNITDKKMPEPGDEELYIGLEHLDSGSLRVTRWGSEVELVGQKLVMQKGDILFGRRNTYLRRAAIAPHDGIFSAHGMIFRPKTEVIDPDYFPFFISSDYFMDAAIRISVGSLSPTVNWKTLKELEFYLPDLNQQRHTAELLSAANETKEAYQNLLSQTDELVKSQFIELFGSGDWRKCRLGDIYDIKSSKRIYAKEIVATGIPFLKVADVLEKISTGSCMPKSYIKEEQYTAFKNAGLVPNPGDILVTSRGTIGKCYIITENDNFYFQDGMISWLKTKPNCTLIPEFTVSLFCEEQFCKALDDATNKTTVTYISLDKLAELSVICPPIDQQQAYLRFLQQHDKSKFELKQAITNISELMKSLMQQDFTN